MNYIRTKIQSLSSGWNLYRVIQLIMGILFVLNGIFEQDLAIGLFGGLFMVMAFLNIGCSACAGNQCKTEKD
jgi:hypothetical protein